MKKVYNFGKMQMNVYWKPGLELDDISLKKLHLNLLKVNEKSGANIIHKMLEKKISIEGVRHHYSNTIISEFIMDGEASAFIVSPILMNNGSPIVHCGLLVIGKNPGINLMGLLSVSNLCMAYEKLGTYHVTNISSTPSSIESFAEIVSKSWPGPDVGLKKAPSGYKEIVHKLKSDYIENYFPDADKIKVDYKRFILSSNSQEMGFVTNFYKISRADNFKYNLFCHSWINYDQEEDVIQVGQINLFSYLRSQIILFFWRRSLKQLVSKQESEQLQENLSYTDKKAA